MWQADARCKRVLLGNLRLALERHDLNQLINSLSPPTCPGNCGKGPNMALPDGTVFKEVGMHKAVDILRKCYGVTIAPEIM